MGSIVPRPFTNPFEKEIDKLKNIFKLWCWKLKLKLTVSRKLSPRMQSVRPATVITTRTIRVYHQTKLKFFSWSALPMTTLSTQNISYKTEDNNNKTTETIIKNLNSCRLVLPFYTKINNINYKRSHLSLLNLINAKKNGSREVGHQHTRWPGVVRGWSGVVRCSTTGVVYKNFALQPESYGDGV